MINKIIGFILIVFVLIIVGWFGVHSYATLDQNADIPENYTDVYESTKALTQGSIGFMSILGYAVAAISLGGVVAAMVFYWYRQ